jgi:hypothetical protein
MSKTITRAQMCGAIIDVWYEGDQQATVYCEHGKTWPEGGYGCIPCIEASRATGTRVVLGPGAAAELLPSNPESVPQPSEEDERRMMEAL